MGLRRMIMQNMCKHIDKDLALNVIEYNTAEITCTAVDHEIICSNCGFVFVECNKFDGIIELLRKSRYLQTPPPSSSNKNKSK